MISSSGLPLVFQMASTTTACLRDYQRPSWKFPKSAKLSRKEVVPEAAHENEGYTNLDKVNGMATIKQST